MDEKRILSPHVVSHLPDCFEERQALNIAHCTPDLHDHDLGAIQPLYGCLDLVGDMGNDLHCFTQVLTLSLLFNHRLIDSSGCRVVLLRHLRVRKPLVMAQIKIRLRTIVGNEHFTVLEGTHGSRVHVEVGIQFEQRDLQSSGFEQTSDRCCRQPLSQRTEDSTGDENELRGHTYLPFS